MGPSPQVLKDESGAEMDSSNAMGVAWLSEKPSKKSSGDEVNVALSPSASPVCGKAGSSSGTGRLDGRPARLATLYTQVVSAAWHLLHEGRSTSRMQRIFRP